MCHTLYSYAAASLPSLQVEAIARELSQCHRSRQPVVAAQLKEARHHLAEHQQQAAELQARGARLQQEAQQAAERCEQALLALQGVQGRLIVSAEERQRVQQEIKGLMEVSRAMSYRRQAILTGCPRGCAGNSQGIMVVTYMSSNPYRATLPWF